MRILFASTRGAGHIGPLIPFAHACVAAGHDVRFATPASAEHHVRRAGLHHVPLGEPDEATMAELWPRVKAAPPSEQDQLVFREVFAGAFARSALPRMLETARAWRPDVILRETTEYAALRAAAEIGVETVHVGCVLGGLGGYDIELDEPLARLGVKAPTQEQFITLAPRALEDPDFPETPGTLRYRTPLPPARPLPDWWNGSAAPLVYVSFGSAAAGNGFFPDLYREAADALGSLPIRVLLTLGTEFQPADLGPVPANVHVEQWVPQGAVMAHASAMVGHGGSGSTLAAMAAAMPLAVVPLFADQPQNARRVAELGAGLAIDGTSGLAGAVTELLEDPFYRANARSIAAEIELLPPVDDVVTLLEELADEEQLAA